APGTPKPAAAATRARPGADPKTRSPEPAKSGALAQTPKKPAPKPAAGRRAGTRVAQAPGSGSEPAKNGGTLARSGTASRVPEKRIRLDFRDVDIDNVLKFFSMATGKTIIKDPTLSGPVTILLPQPVPVSQGLHVLE